MWLSLLKLRDGSVIRFERAEIHGTYATLFAESEANRNGEFGKFQHLEYPFPRGPDVRIADIVWCAKAPNGS